MMQFFAQNVVINFNHFSFMYVESVVKHVNCAVKKLIGITKLLGQGCLDVMIATKAYSNCKFRQRGKIWQSFAENAVLN